MKLNLKFLIEPKLNGIPVVLSVFDGNGAVKRLELINDSVQEIEYRGELNYLSLPSSVKLISLNGFVPQLNQKIVIKNLIINERPVEESSFFDFFDFFIRSDSSVHDVLIKKCREVFCNGDLFFSVGDNKDRLFWCPFYYSSKKDDFVFFNSLLDDFGDPGVRTWSNDTRNSLKRYRNRPHHDYDVGKIYDAACFGCSVTYGTGLETKNIWSNLLSKNSLNLANPTLGFDGIYLNLKNSLKKFQFGKIIVLLPNFERKLVRLEMPMVNGFCRIPINSTNMDWHHSRIKHWAWEMMGIHYNQSQLDEWKNIYIKKCRGMVLDENKKYSKKIFDRMLSLLLMSKKKFYFSSWDEEVYDHLLNTQSISDNILPFFKKIDAAMDMSHPGPRSHAAWADLVKEKINLIDRGL